MTEFSPGQDNIATFLRRARAASLKAKGSRFGALAEEEYDKIAPVIACTLPKEAERTRERQAAAAQDEAEENDATRRK